jgi:hypothetical protein
MDDVLNLRGIYSSKADKTAGKELKTLGEDITAGASWRRGEEGTPWQRSRPCHRWQTGKGGGSVTDDGDLALRTASRTHPPPYALRRRPQAR